MTIEPHYFSFQRRVALKALCFKSDKWWMLEVDVSEPLEECLSQ